MVRTSGAAPGVPVVRSVAWPSVSEIAWGLASDRVAIILAVALLVVTMLAAGPLHPVDVFLNELPRPYWDLLREPLILWPDTVASRAVALPVLLVTAIQLAYWHRSWRPIVLGAVGVVGMMSLVSVMKLAINRGHAKDFDPDFFQGMGNVAFPSGHGANAILIYGLVLFLIIRFAAARPHIIRRLGFCIVAIALLQSTVSVYLHFHWFTDLLAGMVAGGFALRVTIRLDRMFPHGRTAEWWPWYGREAPVETGG
ncbi:phosphoesterase PA-phosphatase [Nocardiopsis sp. CNR-923]|uniref:phosphatase PAP2 family protein n=1 Tax=Nocardiopsis sp. CNR-923 TaxID=1904965 RepID=UPI0009631690|nr:phosphatase PAP2 family protein [Nocardiopsis sp. CNR-923]OLT28709.1 phosphoesterase PA-phosphatase [Nocardiopsis sp. CNR-923]